MKSGDILGHENMGIVVDVGSGVTNLQKGDRIVVPFTISCGECWFCQKGLFSACERTNPNAEMAIKAMGHSPAGLFGFSHMLGGYSGGQAEYLRVPMADVGPIKIPDNVTDEQALFLSDIFPTGYNATTKANAIAGKSTPTPAAVSPPAAPPAMKFTTLPPATAGQPYGHFLSVNGRDSTTQWTLKGGALPPGLTLNSDGSFGGTAQAEAAGHTFQFSVLAMSHASSATISFAVAVA